MRGTIHLYKPEEISEKAMVGSLPSDRSPVVLIFGVPSYMKIEEFVSFCGIFAKSMKHIRVLRDESPNRYMLLILFRDQQTANSFYVEYNGKNFSLMTSEICHIGFVDSVEFVHPKNAPLWPPSGQYELPHCTICLERLDATVSGLLTVICNHSFHCDCLLRWQEENICPVCRYMQTPRGDESVCGSCGITDSLWICLICGFVGCSRYKNKHSEEHFIKTKHTFAMEVDTKSVWDYTRDSYVHRIATNFNDGKLVPLPEINWEVELANTIKLKDTGLGKDEAVELEWQYLLEAHLETQKRFFEDRIKVIEMQNQNKLKYLEQEYAGLLEEKLDIAKKMEQIERQKKGLEKRTQELEKKMSTVAQEKDFLVVINKEMEKNQSAWKEKAMVTEEKLKKAQIDAEKDSKIQELEEQVRDLMFYIENQKKLANSEFENAELVVVPSPETNQPKANKPNKNKQIPKKPKKK
uniref:BRCA1-associated protein n=1 Tax=Arcella intermedia TaxID=1963864 RepID=A0A6B2L352_9EUKA